MHMLLDHMILGYVGGGKWLGMRLKPCRAFKSVLTVALYTVALCIDSGTLG